MNQPINQDLRRKSTRQARARSQFSWVFCVTPPKGGAGSRRREIETQNYRVSDRRPTRSPQARGGATAGLTVTLCHGAAGAAGPGGRQRRVGGKIGDRRAENARRARGRAGGKPTDRNRHARSTGSVIDPRRTAL